MERPCYQCGLTVEDVVIFCPQCRAPQICAVSTMPAPRPVKLGILRRPALVPQAAIDWSHALPSVILAVLIAALLNRADFGGPGLILCGALAVVFYGQRNKLAPIRRRAAILLGAISGILATAVTAFFHYKTDIEPPLTQALQMSLARNSDPVAKQIFINFIAQHPHFFPIVGLLGLGGMYLITSGLGGMIAASLVNRWRPSTPATSSDHENKLDHHENTERSDHD